MYNWYGTSEENARGNSPANNVSGLLTENYAFRSSEHEEGEEEGGFSISSNRYSSPLLSGREISNQWNDSKGEEKFFCEGVPRGVFLSTRVRFSFAEKSARARQVGASELGATTTTTTNVVSLNPSCNLLCNTRFRDQSLKGDSNFARIIDGYLGGFPL